MKTRFLLLCLTILLLSSCKTKDAIKFTYTPETNYVTHLYTLGELVYNDDEYISKYGSSTPEEEINILKKYKNLLTFGQGQQSELSSCFFFAGIYSKYSNNQDIKNILTNDVLPYIDSTNINAFKEIAGVYYRNYDSYLKNVYPKIKKDLKRRCDFYKSKTKHNNIIKNWEKVTGYKWNKGDYTFILHRAGNNGPSFNDNGESLNSFYYNMDVDYTLAMISHEFGVHIMINQCYAKLDKEVDQPTSWKALENLAIWFNCKIKGGYTIDYYTYKNSDSELFYQIYDKIYNSGITEPSEMFVKAIELYQQKKK